MGKRNTIIIVLLIIIVNAIVSFAIALIYGLFNIIIGSTGLPIPESIINALNTLAYLMLGDPTNLLIIVIFIFMLIFLFSGRSRE